jgi:flagellar protein FlaG
MAIQPVSSSSALITAASAPARETSAVAATNETTATQTPPAAQAASATPSREQIDQAMTEVKKAIAPVARNLQFSIDDETGRSVVKVIDASTNEVIRQFPSEELLAITRSIDKFSGLFVKQKA